MLPKGFDEVKGAGVYYNKESGEVVVLGLVEDDDETHNCDVMGCSSVNHVVLRGRLEET